MCKTVKSYIDALRFECQHLLYWINEPIFLIFFLNLSVGLKIRARQLGPPHRRQRSWTTRARPTFDTLLKVRFEKEF